MIKRALKKILAIFFIIAMLSNSGITPILSEEVLKTQNGDAHNSNLMAKSESDSKENENQSQNNTENTTDDNQVAEDEALENTTVEDLQDNKEEANEENSIKVNNDTELSEAISNTEVEKKDGNDKSKFQTKRLIVVSDHEFDTCGASLVIDGYSNLKILTFKTEEDTQNAYEKLSADTTIEYVDVDNVFTTNTESEENTQATATQDVAPIVYGKSSKDIVVAVIDSGVDGSAIGEGHMLQGINYSSTGNFTDTSDSMGHGTQMASIITQNMADTVKILPIKVTDSNGLTSAIKIYMGIQYAIQNNAKVINISLTSYSTGTNTLIEKAIKEAKDKGIFVVVSAGNFGDDVANYSPANVSDAIVVSAINTDNSFMDYSNYGDTIDFAASSAVKCKTVGGEEITAAGTSVSAAVVSKIIANGYILDNDYSYNDIYNLLLKYAVDGGDKGWDKYYGNGYLTSSRLTTIYDTTVCKTAEIFTADWKNMSDEELGKIISYTSSINLSTFLKKLNKTDLNNIVSRNVGLNGKFGVANYKKETDGTYKEIGRKEYVYYKYLLENDFYNVSEIQNPGGTAKINFYTDRNGNSSWAQISSISKDGTQLSYWTNPNSDVIMDRIALRDAEQGEGPYMNINGANLAKIQCVITNMFVNKDYHKVYSGCTHISPAATNGGIPNETSIKSGNQHGTLQIMSEFLMSVWGEETHRIDFKYANTGIVRGYAIEDGTGRDLNSNQPFDQQSLTEGQTYNMKTLPNTPSGYKFVRWSCYPFGSTDAVNNQVQTTNSLNTFCVNSVCSVYYAVYAKPEYTRTIIVHYEDENGNYNTIGEIQKAHNGENFPAFSFSSLNSAIFNIPADIPAKYCDGNNLKEEIYVTRKWYTRTIYLYQQDENGTDKLTQTVPQTVRYGANYSSWSPQYDPVIYKYRANSPTQASEVMCNETNQDVYIYMDRQQYYQNVIHLQKNSNTGGYEEIYRTSDLKYYGSTFTPSAIQPNTGYHYDRIERGTYTVTGNTNTNVWYEPNTYYIRYNGNQNTGGSTSTKTILYDKIDNLTANGFIRQYNVKYDYNGSGQSANSIVVKSNFDGWGNPTFNSGSYASPITNPNIGMRDRAFIQKLTPTNGATIDLLAHWTLGTTVLPTPSRTGHNFLGWDTNKNATRGTYAGNSTYTPTADTTLYSIWEPWTLKVNINLKDAETGNTIKSYATYKVYEFNTSTGNYDKFVMNLSQKSDSTYITSNYLTYSDTNLGKFRIIEDTAPNGYYGDWTDASETQKVCYDFNIEEIIRTKNYAGQNVSDKGTIYIETRNTRVKGQVNANIIDTETKGAAQANATLEGAVYGIYARQNIVHADGTKGILYTAGSIVQRATFVNGKLSYNDLELGEYYLKQITPPNGYTKSANEYNVSVTYEGEKVELVTRNVTVEEKVNKQAFQLIKVGNVGDNDEFIALENAGFKVYLISDLIGVKNGQIKPDTYGNYNQDSFKDYDFSNDLTALNYANTSAGEHISELFTDSDGYLLSPELAYGKYVVIESTVPEERVQIKPFLIDVVEDNRNPKKLRVFFDAEFTAKIQVIKKDADTNKIVLKPNAKYRILNKETNTYVEQWMTYPVKVLMGTEENPYTTDESGTMTTPLSLRVGEYQLQEIGAPEGYVIVGHEGISDRGVYRATPSSYVDFRISKATALEYDEDTKDAILKVEQYDKQQVGSLTVNVSGEYLNGYTKDANANYNFEYQTRPIEGIEFTLYAKYNIYSQDNQKDIVYSKDEAVATIKSDSNGKCIFDNLPIGMYYIKETKSVDGFVINKLAKDVEIAYEGQEQAVVYRNESYTNERQKVEITLTNKDNETDELLPGGKFGLFTKEKIKYTDENGQSKEIEADEMIYTVTADENGVAKWNAQDNVDLPLGKYYIKQLEAPYGYVTNHDIVDVNAQYIGEDKDKVEINIEFTNQQTKTLIKKQDEETKNGLSNVEMKLLNSNREELYSWTTDDTGEKYINKLQRGETYILQEIKPRENYINDMLIDTNNNNQITKVNTSEITFVVNDVLDLQNIIIGNKSKVGNINITKQGEVLVDNQKDNDGNTTFVYEKQNLANAEYDIVAKEDIVHPDGHTGTIISAGVTVAKAITGVDGILVTTIDTDIQQGYTQEVQQMLQRGLPLGKYEIVETKAPEGYYRDQENCTKDVDVLEEANDKELLTYDVTFENERQKVEITLTNKDIETNELIPNAEFGLYAKQDITYTDKNGISQKISADELIYKVTTDENGIAKWNAQDNVDLPLGNYYIKQLNAGYGYVTNNDVIDVDATYQGQDKDKVEINIEFTNQQTKTLVKKQDEETKNGLSNVEMKLLNSNREELYSWTTDDTGEKYINKLQRGETYILQEIKPRENYVNDMLVDANNNNQITKVNTSEVTFVVNDVLDLQNIIIGNKSKVGNIDIIKKGDVLVGAEKDSEGNINFKYELQNLAGAEYEIYAKEDIIHPDGHVGTIIPAGTKVADAMTTKDGIWVTNVSKELQEINLPEIQQMLQRGIPLGKYEIKETKAPEGYYRDESNCKQDAELKENDSNDEIVLQTNTFINNRQTINSDDETDGTKTGIYKYDEDTKEPIQNAIIGVYTKDDIVENGNVILEKDTLIQKGTTDENGRIKLKSNLPLGKYYVQEIQAAKGYEYKDNKIEIDFTKLDENKTNTNMLVEIYNRKTEVNILKTDIKENPLKDSELQIKDSDGNVVQKWKTTDKSYNIRGLETEKQYTLEETRPTDGYVTEDKKQFSFDKFGKIKTEEENLYNENTIIMKDEKTKVKISVIDEETKENVSGVHIQIINKETQKTIYEYDTTDESKYIEGLPIGEYDIVQTIITNGYVTTHSTIKVEDTKELQDKVLEQKYTKALIKITDLNDNSKIDKVEIQIKDKDSKVIASTKADKDIIKISETDKGYSLERIPVGKYTVEITVPEGYKQIEKIDTSIADTAELQTIEAKSRKLILDMKVEKYLKAITINGNRQQVQQDGIKKIEIKRKLINTQKVRLEYIIKVSNTGEIAGNIERIVDELPQGMTFIASESDSSWKKENGIIYSTDYAKNELDVGKSKEYKVVLQWDNSQSNFGQKINKASLQGVTNKLKYIDSNQENSNSQATVLFSIATGENASVIIELISVMLFTISLIAIFVIIELKILAKK